MILVTGGAGFIGSNFIMEWLSFPSAEGVVNLDKLTYAGNVHTLKAFSFDDRHVFFEGDICDIDLITFILKKYHIRAIINFAAESHVDKSISNPSNFINTNVLGIFNLLEASRAYWNNLPYLEKKLFRFLNVSTDEVYGSLNASESSFSEESPYKPNNPYSASKAAADHLVRAWCHTYNLPVITTNCSNNYGPYQFPEKLIPLVILSALEGKLLPIYGDGQQIRDWIYVQDHCEALRYILKFGQVGNVYNIGGDCEKRNIQVVNTICTILDSLEPRRDGISYLSQIHHVNDRVGHDKRYAINSSKLKRELFWQPRVVFEVGILKTINWYLKNKNWIRDILKK